MLSWCVLCLLRSAFLVHSGSCLGGPYPRHFSPIRLLCRIGVLTLSGFSFWCYIGSRFIIRFHCGGFNRSYLVAGLLGASLASPFLQDCVFDCASLAQFLYFLSSGRIRKSEVLLNSRPSSLLQAAVAGPVVAQRCHRRRDNFFCQQ